MIAGRPKRVSTTGSFGLPITKLAHLKRYQGLLQRAGRSIQPPPGWVFKHVFKQDPIWGRYDCACLLYHIPWHCRALPRDFRGRPHRIPTATDWAGAQERFRVL